MVFKIFKYRDSHNFSLPVKEDIDVHKFFHPVAACMHYLGWLDLPDRSPGKLPRFGLKLLYFCRIIYLTAVWLWTIVMSVNIFYMGVSVDPKNDGVQHGNMVIALLEECPFAFITIRNAVILTLFFVHSQQLLDGIESCESLRKHLSTLGRKVTFERYSHRPICYLIVSCVIIVLFEVYEWTVWFTTSGEDYVWDFKPFPFTCTQLHYGYFWWAFTTIPFFLSQLALCFPVLFAYILRRYVRYVNKELGVLARDAKELEEPGYSINNSRSQLEECGHRVIQLRTAHFLITQLMHKLDKAVNGMLLTQFVCDVVTLFGFVGLLVNSKDTKPPLDLIEWTFYIPVSFTWISFFLFIFSFPLIHLAEEGEKTNQLVHAVTFSSVALFEIKFKDLSIFLTQAKEDVVAFTGAYFYHINRHYIVTVLALTASYLTVLTEILDRYYSTEDLKHSIITLARLVTNNSKTELILH